MSRTIRKGAQPNERQKITVTTHGGKVTLTGSVDTPGDRYIAGAAAWTPWRATALENDLIAA